MQIEPYDAEVACAGPTAPACDQILSLIQLLVTIHSRFGNTAVKYRIQWGGSALWAEDAQKRKIANLERMVVRLRNKIKKLESK